MTADCAPYRLEAGQPLASGIKKSGAFSDDDPEAAFTRAFLGDPVVSLPAGDWRITAGASLVEGEGCSGASRNLACTDRGPRHALRPATDVATIASRIATSSRAPVGCPVRMVTPWGPSASSQLSASPGEVRTTGVSGWISRMFSTRARAPSASPLAHVS